jgi:hypothetical protein
MFKAFFSKMGKAAYTTAQQHTAKQKMFKGSTKFSPSASFSMNINYKFSAQAMDGQQMYFSFYNRESISMLMRTSPLGNAVALNLLNLR